MHNKDHKDCNCEDCSCSNDKNGCSCNDSGCCQDDVFDVEAYIGEVVPKFSFDVVNPNGEIENYSLKNNFKNDKWTILMFYPKDFTPVCTTEMVELSNRVEDFKAANAEVIGVSADTVQVHKAWIEQKFKKLNFPLAEDPLGEMAKYFRIWNYYKGFSWRGTFIICNDGNLWSQNINFQGAGRDIDDIYRTLLASQNAKAGKAVPCNWKPGKEFIK